MSINIQLKSKPRGLYNVEYSPIINFHYDSEFWKQFVEKWREDLLKWKEERAPEGSILSGLPLGRLELSVAFADLLYHITKEHVENEMVYKEDRILGSLRVYNSNDDLNEDELYIIEL